MGGSPIFETPRLSSRRLMVEFGIIAVPWLVGAALSLRFRVFALVPAISFMLVLVAAAEISRGGTAWSTVATVLLVTISAELGYFVGSSVWVGFGNWRRVK